jgi:ankyrin repeat protein
MSEKRANVNKQDNNGQTVLRFEAKIVCKAIHLLVKQANIDIQGELEFALLGLDRFIMDWFTVDRFIMDSTNVGICDEDGQRAPQYEKLEELLDDVIRLLRQANVQIPSTGFSPVPLTRRSLGPEVGRNLKESIQMLLDLGNGRFQAVAQDLKRYMKMLVKRVDVNRVWSPQEQDLDLGCHMWRLDELAENTSSHEWPVGHRLDVVIQQLVMRANVNIRDADGRTALHWAAESENGNGELVKLLVECGANVNEQDNHGRTALYQAVDKENKKVVELLVRYDEKQDVHKALELAMTNGFETIIQLLLTSAHVRGEDKQRVLKWAVDKKHINLLRTLLQKPVDVAVDVANENGQAALKLAVDGRHKDLLRQLLDNDVDVTKENGLRALSWAVQYQCMDVVKRLLEKGAKVDAQVEDQLSPMQYAVNRNNKEMVKLLGQAGADLKKTNSRGQTLLHMAVMGSVEVAVVEALVKLKADVNARDSQGQTPLHVAIMKYQGKVAVIEALVKLGADKDARDSQGRTPLQVAEGEGWEAVVEVLTRRALRS